LRVVGTVAQIPGARVTVAPPPLAAIVAYDLLVLAAATLISRHPRHAVAVIATASIGVLLATGGLGPAATRVRSSAGKVTVTDGPFTETKELTGGFALVEVKSREEAIEWAKRFRKIVGDGDSLVQEVFGG